MTLRLHPVGAAFGVDALVCKTEPFDWTAVDEVLLDNFCGIFGLDVAIPDGFGIDNDRWAMFALVETSGFVDANRAAQTSGFGELL